MGDQNQEWAIHQRPCCSLMMLSSQMAFSVLLVLLFIDQISLDLMHMTEDGSFPWYHLPVQQERSGACHNSISLGDWIHQVMAKGARSCSSSPPWGRGSSQRRSVCWGEMPKKWGKDELTVGHLEWEVRATYLSWNTASYNDFNPKWESKLAGW